MAERSGSKIGGFLAAGHPAVIGLLTEVVADADQWACARLGVA